MTSDIASPNALLDPARAVLVLMDHQPMTLFGVHSHDPQSVVNNVTALAKTAKAFDVPVIMTTVAHDGIGGDILPELQSLFPDQVPIDRTWINCWQDLWARLRELAQQRRRFGYRRLHILLRRHAGRH